MILMMSVDQAKQHLFARSILGHFQPASQTGKLTLSPSEMIGWHPCTRLDDYARKARNSYIVSDPYITLTIDDGSAPSLGARLDQITRFADIEAGRRVADLEENCSAEPETSASARALAKKYETRRH